MNYLHELKDVLLQYPIISACVVSTAMVLKGDYEHHKRDTIRNFADFVKHGKPVYFIENGRQKVYFSFKQYIPLLGTIGAFTCLPLLFKHFLLTTMCRAYPEFLMQMGMTKSVFFYGFASYFYNRFYTNGFQGPHSTLFEILLQSVYGFFYLHTNNAYVPILGEYFQNIFVSLLFVYNTIRKVEKLKFDVPSDVRSVEEPTPEMAVEMLKAIA